MMHLKKTLLCLGFALLLMSFGGGGRAYGQVQEAWAARYNGPSNGSDGATGALAVDSAGNVYVTGWSEGSGTSFDYATLKYDPDGNLLWEQRYNGSGNGFDQANALAVDSAGNVYVTGVSGGSGTGFDYATLKYDPDGNLLWEQRYNGPGNGSDVAAEVAVDSAGNVHVTGHSVGSGTGSDYATLKYDPDGNLLWEQRYNGPGNGVDGASALAVDSTGNVYVTGGSVGSGTGSDYATLKYDPDGNLLWEQRYNGPINGVDGASALAVDSTGNLSVTGHSEGSGTSFDYATLKYGSNGNFLWEQRYNGPGNEVDQANAIAADSAGNVHVTGHSMGSDTGSDYATLKYGPDGNLLWEQRYNGPGNAAENATALALDIAGNVSVTGLSAGSGTGWDYATLEYDPDGNLLWEQRYNGPGNGNDSATALVIDSTGNVHVTGRSWGGSGTKDDYATLKYVPQ